MQCITQGLSERAQHTPLSVSYTCIRPQLGGLISIGFGGPHSVRSRMIFCLSMSITALPSMTRYNWEEERGRMRMREEMEKESGGKRSGEGDRKGKRIVCGMKRHTTLWIKTVEN